ncbi:pyridoxal phosphate biosynthetic protein PdxJ [Methylocella silvestris BL2]|uniref:Pyridoxine 5'-phosphate synthase n=1 Tax=Methylocella silvestris (strain DSM 15510 / CIP 108128 / LMG 27833 / NCIMB 13906 / BL2) TaxID=395965 RepID=B8EK16_METSB|nr:pyridoxine 5'-phosphate synthase [Methylocella silvestris]ACK49963.1 pyridoxal phosphate biosynthetic protein PdxJ [Methylocella silvestris BL2]
MSHKIPRLGVNVDHVATLRNARGAVFPDPVRAALVAIAAGADGITAHLREDRRHIRDEDMARLKREISVPLNFEMAATNEMVAIAIATRPHACCLVPERRSERTTEGGLNVLDGHDHLKLVTAELGKAGVRVSLFIEPGKSAVEAAESIGAPVVELHTGSWCDALAHGEKERAAQEFIRIQAAATLAEKLGLECHAGHGLDFATAATISALPQIAELNIGHFLVSEAIFIGLPEAIRTMREAIAAGRAKARQGAHGEHS